ncbi:MAG: hypothetical protein GYA02_05385 [Clostridiaceae bacterium]|nr:hypothetical protein [Clostridiaceae bacterium]
MKNYYSLAVENLPASPVKVYGPFRLTKYAQFLIREVFPKHDELCYEEGKLMLQYIRGEQGEEAAQMLKRLKGQTIRLYEHYWK